MKPFPDQQIFIDKILKVLETEGRCFGQLPTGGGKTACFSFLAKDFIARTGKKVLIVAHREELINQTITTLRKIGVSCESVVAANKNLNHLSNTYVAMIETLKRRLRNDDNYLKDVGLIVIDEAHILLHSEIFEYYPNAKILGVSATPSLLKKVDFCKCHRCGRESKEVETCCNVEMFEYKRNYTLSEIYINFVAGTKISELIENDRLVQDVVFSVRNINRDLLEKDIDGEFKESEEFSSSDAVFDLVKNYEKHCLGKKTLIFHASAKTNLLSYQTFIDAGYPNTKLYDSKNSVASRKDTLKWFKETPDAILHNVSCFTTGFDEPTLECIMINRATASLTLYHQMTGRGGRVCDSIYKPTFSVIDFGGNFDNFGQWSHDVDWQAHFFGTNDKPRPKKIALEDTRMCTKCELIIPKRTIECPECAHIETAFRRDKTQTVSKEIATLASEYPMPNGAKIVKYVKSNGKDRAFAYEILVNQMVDVFIYRDVYKEQYLQSLENGTFHERVKVAIEKPTKTFFPHFGVKNLRSFEWITLQIKIKLDKYYGLK